jgi:hypothetical protein
MRRYSTASEQFSIQLFVMAGLVPAIHVFAAVAKKDVDARHKAGHDDGERFRCRLVPL